MTNLPDKTWRDGTILSTTDIDSVLCELLYGSSLGYMITQRKEISKEAFFLTELVLSQHDSDWI